MLPAGLLKAGSQLVGVRACIHGVWEVDAVEIESNDLADTERNRGTQPHALELRAARSPALLKHRPAQLQCSIEIDKLKVYNCIFNSAFRANEDAAPSDFAEASCFEG